MILRIIILSLLLTLIVRAVRMLIGGIIDGSAPRPRSQPPPMRLVRDPVCGTHVPARTALSVTSGGTTHFFCSEECRRKFGTP